MDVNRILENYVIRQVFVLVGVIFLVFGGIFLAAPVRRFTELCLSWGKGWAFLGGWALFFLTRIRIGASPDCPGRIRTDFLAAPVRRFTELCFSWGEGWAFLGGMGVIFFLRGFGSGQAPIALARIRTGDGLVRIFLSFWIGGGAELESYGGY